MHGCRCHVLLKSIIQEDDKLMHSTLQWALCKLFDTVAIFSSFLLVPALYPILSLCLFTSTSHLSSLIPLSSLSSSSALTFSAGDLPQVPSRSDSYSGSVPHWHEEGASVGSHRHDGAVRPLRAGGQKTQNQQEENPRYGSTDTQKHCWCLVSFCRQ